MSSCSTYGTQCLDTGAQLQASNIAFDNTATGSNCAHVQCYLEFIGSNQDEMLSTLTAHLEDVDNPHAGSLEGLTDTTILDPLVGQVAMYDGTNWVNEDPVTGVTDHLLMSNIGTNSHEIIDEHIADLVNPHMVTYAQLPDTPEPIEPIDFSPTFFAAIFEAGWQNTGLGLQTARYWIDLFGVVHLEGHVDRTVPANVNIFILPVGFRPLQGQRFPVDALGIHEAVSIDPSGEVQMSAGNDIGIALSGITFQTG